MHKEIKKSQNEWMFDPEGRIYHAWQQPERLVMVELLRRDLPCLDVHLRLNDQQEDLTRDQGVPPWLGGWQCLWPRELREDFKSLPRSPSPGKTFIKKRRHLKRALRCLLTGYEAGSLAKVLDRRVWQLLCSLGQWP